MAKKVAAKKTAKKATSKTTKAKTLKKGGRNFEEVKGGMEYWKPEKRGDSVEGIFIEIQERPNRLGKKGDMQKQVILESETTKGRICLPDHFQITSAVEKAGEGYYVITCDYVGGKKPKGAAKAEAYKYTVLHSAE